MYIYNVFPKWLNPGKFDILKRKNQNTKHKIRDICFKRKTKYMLLELIYV